MDTKKHFCIVPWIHLHIWPNGNAYPCCISDSDKIIGKLTDTVSITDLWNSPKLREIRLHFLDDKAISECKRCYEIEETGAVSPRMDFNRVFAHHKSTVETTAVDGTVDKVNMAYMDIRFSNLCNLRCRTCGPDLSSRWFADANELGIARSPIAIQKPLAEPLALWEQIEKFLPTVEVIYFAGGEPLLTEEHYRILQWLIDNGRTDVKLRYNTNFTNLKYKNLNVLDMWAKFKHVSVGASLDAMEERAEYMRKETEWIVIEDNRRQMIERCPNAEFYVNFTFSVFNFATMIEFHNTWVKMGLIRPDDWNINYLTFPPSYRTDIVPENFRNTIISRYTAYLSYLKEQHNVNNTTVRRWESAMDFLRGPQQMDGLENFRTLTKRMDEIRSENFASVFPELAFLME